MADEHIEKFLGFGKKKDEEGTGDPQKTDGKVDQPETIGQRTKQTVSNVANKVKNTFSNNTKEGQSGQSANTSGQNTPKEEPWLNVELGSRTSSGMVQPKTVSMNGQSFDGMEFSDDGKLVRSDDAKMLMEAGWDGQSPLMDSKGNVLGYAKQETPGQGTDGTPQKDGQPAAEPPKTGGQPAPGQPSQPLQGMMANIRNNNLMPPEPSITPRDRAMAAAHNLAISPSIIAGFTEGVEKAIDVLVDMSESLTSGNAFNIGKNVATMVTEGVKNIAPVLQSFNTALGINEKNGTIDPDAVGTIRGAKFYQNQRRMGQFYTNVNTWLKDTMKANGIDSTNMMDYMNKMTPKQLQKFANRYNQMVEGEKQRLYAKAAAGQLDKMDQAMLSAYTDIGKKLSLAAQQSAREHNLQAAKLRTKGTQLRAQIDRNRIDYLDAVRDKGNELRDPTGKHRGTREEVLYSNLEPKIRQGLRTGKQYYVLRNNGYVFDEDMLDSQDIDRIIRDLRNRYVNHGKRFTPEENDLYRDMLKRKEEMSKVVPSNGPPAPQPTATSPPGKKGAGKKKPAAKPTGKKNTTVKPTGKKKTKVRPTSTSKSAMIDAEGLTFGELFRIVKAKRPEMSDQEAEDFTNDTFYNVGQIDSKDDLYKEVQNTSGEGDKGFPSYQGVVGSPTNLAPDSPRSPYFRPRHYWDFEAWKERQDSVNPIKTPKKTPKKKEQKEPAYKPAPDVQNVLGRTKNPVNQRRKIGAYIKQWVDEQGITEGTRLSREQREHIIPFDEEFHRLSGKHIWEVDALRGDQAAALREMYYRNQNYGDAADQMANRYFPDTDEEKRRGYSDLIYDMLGRGISLDDNDLLVNRSGERYSREDKSRDHYLNMYRSFQNYADRFIDDPEISDALKVIWRNYTADAIKRMGSSRGMESDDKDEAVFLRELGKKVVNDLHLSEKEEGDFSRESAKEKVDRAIRRRLQQLRTGEYVPNTPIGGRSYLSNTLGEILEYGNAHISRLKNDKTRRDKGAKMAKLMNAYDIPLDKMMAMSPPGAGSSMRSWAKNNLSKETMGKVYNTLNKAWADMNRSISYGKFKEKYGTDPDFIESMRQWEEYQNRMEAILKGLKKAWTTVPDGFDPAPSNKKKVAPGPGAKKPYKGNANRSSKNVLSGSNYVVDDVEYRDGQLVTDENGKRLIEATLFPILDKYKTEKKVGMSTVDYLRNLDTETLQTMKAWLLANIDRGKAYNVYSGDRGAYRKEWKAKGLPEPGTVVNYSGHTRFLPMFEDVLKAISKEIRSRKV